ncbi:MAG: ankyrin repeat domain-containing protein, partial [Clostridia bacterium]
VDTVNKDGQIPLHVAAQDSRRQDALLMLLKNGSDINSQDARGWTPVFQAINSMNYGMVRILIKADANLKLENFEGETPLMRCVRRGRKDYLWALLGSGKVNIYSRNFLGETALDLARKFGRHDCEQILESAHKKLLTGDDLKFMTKYCEDWRSRHSACK